MHLVNEWFAAGVWIVQRDQEDRHGPGRDLRRGSPDHDAHVLRRVREYGPPEERQHLRDPRSPRRTLHRDDHLEPERRVLRARAAPLRERGRLHEQPAVEPAVHAEDLHLLTTTGHQQRPRQLLPLGPVLRHLSTCGLGCCFSPLRRSGARSQRCTRASPSPTQVGNVALMNHTSATQAPRHIGGHRRSLSIVMRAVGIGIQYTLVDDSS